jgi:DNA-binding PadR family transcriptional regulator
VYGLWLLEELAEHGHRLSPGTLYPALARMEKNGWLARCGDSPHPRARRTFRITGAGRRVLKMLQPEVSELYEELVLGREPRESRGPRGAARAMGGSSRERSDRRGR